MKDISVILKDWMDVLESTDSLQVNVPVSVGVSTSGRVLLSFSLSQTPQVFDDFDGALAAIEEWLLNHESIKMKDYKVLYESLVDEIKYEKERAEALCLNMKEENLTFATLEAEGFLRGMITVFHLIDHVETYTQEG